MAFHVRLFHCPAMNVAANSITLSSGSLLEGWKPEDVSDEDWKSGQFETTFEATFAALEGLDRMFIELDGSFVWRGAETEWQIDGHLYDRNDRLYYLELSGNGPQTKVRQLLDVASIDTSELLVEHVKEGALSRFHTWAETLP